MSIEVRRVTRGECDCSTPKYSWEERHCHAHYWECDYGPIPSFSIENPAPLIIVSRDWIARMWRNGPCTRPFSRRIDTVRFVPIPDADGEITATSAVRMFHRIDYRGRSWTWELETAHWADPPTRFQQRAYVDLPRKVAGLSQTPCVCGHESYHHFAHVGICIGNDCGCSYYLPDDGSEPTPGTPVQDNYAGIYAGKKWAL